MRSPGDGEYWHRPPSGSGGGRIPKAYRRSDDRIREDLYEALMRREHLDLGDVSIEVQGGRVRLEGFVRERHMKHEIEDVAAGCQGVEDVDNRIRVGRAAGERVDSDAGGDTADLTERSRTGDAPGNLGRNSLRIGGPNTGMAAALTGDVLAGSASIGMSDDDPQRSRDTTSAS